MNRLPSLLVSYAVLKPEHVPLAGQGFDEWVLDSGAYTAHNSGKVIKPDDFVKFALATKQNDARLKYVFALDVIGDPEASMKNALAAQTAGLEVIPTWHAGEPIEFAQELAKQFPRIALGGLVARLENNRAQLFDVGTKVHHAEKFFQAVWPKWVHGFGCTDDTMMTRLPFASVDSSSWEFGPAAFGMWKQFGKIPLSLTQARRKVVLKTEVDWYLNRERFHDAQWRKELSKVGCERFRIRLAADPESVVWLSAMFCPSETGAALTTSQRTNIIQKAKPVTRKSTDASPMKSEWVDYWSSRVKEIKSQN